MVSGKLKGQKIGMPVQAGTITAKEPEFGTKTVNDVCARWVYATYSRDSNTVLLPQDNPLLDPSFGIVVSNCIFMAVHPPLAGTI
jgi:hypothetical protein